MPSTATSNGNGGRLGRFKKSDILFLVGIGGFIYEGIAPIFGVPTHVEFIIGCLALVGIPIASRIDSK